VPAGAEGTLPGVEGAADRQSVMRPEDDFSVGHEEVSRMEVSRTVRTVEETIGTMDFGGIIIGTPASGAPTGMAGAGMDIHTIPTATDTTPTTTMIRALATPTVLPTATMAANRDRLRRMSKPSCEGKDTIEAALTELSGLGLARQSGLSRKIEGYRSRDGLTGRFCVQCVLFE
jgi:hypothetical protein